MRIIDSQGNEITSPNLENGRLIEEQIVKEHHAATEAVEEVSHYVTVAEYPNGGKDIEKVIDVPASPARDAWDEYETVQRYVEYSPTEKVEIQIAALKRNLAGTDYVVIKIAEGVATKDDYAEIIAQRQQWRSEINELENAENE